MSRKPALILCTLSLVLSAGHAQDIHKTFSLTLSPNHLVFPVFEVTAEKALGPKFGLAGIGGFGSYPAERGDGTKEDIPVLELGAQANYYVFGDFDHGMQVGGELMWIKVSPPEEAGITVDANGLAIGPLLGYKWAARFGLTFMFQGGYQWYFIQAKAKNSQGEEIEGSVENGVALINMNAGWSF